MSALDGISAPPRNERFSAAAQRWFLFYALIAAAWLLLFALHLDFTRVRLAFGAPFAPEFWRAMCATQPGFSAISSMWSLMAVGFSALNW